MAPYSVYYVRNFYQGAEIVSEEYCIHCESYDAAEYLASETHDTEKSWVIGLKIIDNETGVEHALILN